MKQDNLTPFTKETVSRDLAVINGRKGGLAKARNRKLRKMIKDILNEILSEKTTVTGPDGEEYTLTKKEAMCIAGIEKAMQGDRGWFELIRDTIGEKPADRVVVSEIPQETIDELEALVHGEERGT